MHQHWQPGRTIWEGQEEEQGRGDADAWGTMLGSGSRPDRQLRQSWTEQAQPLGRPVQEAELVFDGAGCT